VFDGHNGKDATHYVRDNLPWVIMEHADNFLQTAFF
jgi:protein phosphatase 2C family protein 2/3